MSYSIAIGVKRTVVNYWFLPVVIGVPCAVFVLIVAGVLIYCFVFKKRKDSSLENLPSDIGWFFSKERISKAKYRHNGNYYYKKVKPNSREDLFLKMLKPNLDFGNIIISDVTAVVNPTLVQSFQNLRKLYSSQLTETPDKFYSQKWKDNDDTGMRSRTMKKFMELTHHWEWNRDLKIQDIPILAMVHGTDKAIADNISNQGFASLSDLDAGYYGNGIYFTSSARCTIPYLARKKNPVIIVALVIPGNPYPVIEHPQKKIPFLENQYLVDIKAILW